MFWLRLLTEVLKLDIVIMVNVLKFLKHFTFFFSNKMVVIRAEMSKLVVCQNSKQ